VGGRPVLNLSFALNYALSGSRVWSWHVVNVILHVLAGLCLFGIVRRTLTWPGAGEQGARHATLLALATALLWTVHPLTTESVTYIVQRAESLAGLFLLLTLYCSIRAAQCIAGPLPRSVWQIAAVLACLVGMATKEVMVVAPLLVVLYDWAFAQGMPAGTIKGRRWFYAALASTWILLGALVLGSSSRGGSAGFGQGIGCWDYARTQFGFIALYLKLCLWPHPLVFDYGDQIAMPSGKLIAAGALVVSLVLATLAALCSRRYRPLGFLGACFFCILAPSSSILPVVTQTGAEHRMYLPSAAVVSLVVMVLARIWSRIATNWRPLWQAVPPIAVLILAALTLVLLTALRNADYRTDGSIWSDTVKKRPENWRARYSLGCHYYYAGKLEDALAEYTRSIALNSKEFAPLQYRGFTCLKLRKFQEAEADFMRALELNSRDAATHCNLSVARAGAGELEPALASATEAVRLSPSNSSYHRQRGTILTRLGRHAEALRESSEAVHLDPRSAAAYRTRAVAYTNLKRYESARADVEEMQRLGAQPDREFLDRLTREETAAGGGAARCTGIDGL
jgi:Flp pilus assembly protein TadD